MINSITKDAETHMQKTIDAFNADMKKLRTGRANPAMIEHLKVDYYGTETALSHIASIMVSDARTLVVTPWEKTMIKPIEKAILNADLGLNPISDVNSLRVPMPPLTEDRRKELVKVVKSTAEQSRVAIRNMRRDANAALKDLLKKKEINEDEERKAQDAIQKVTDKFIAEVDKIAESKEVDLLH